MVDAFTESDYAGIVRRVVAWVLDVVAFSISWFVLLVAATLANEGVLEAEDGLAFAMIAVPALLWKTLWVASPLRGTPGHRVAGIRVVRPDGSRVSLARAAGRTLVEAAMYAFFLVGMVLGGITILASRRRQAIHDMVAGTVCVERDALVRLGSPQHVATHLPQASAASTAASTARTTTASTSTSTTAPTDAPRPQTTEERHRGPFL